MGSLLQDAAWAPQSCLFSSSKVHHGPLAMFLGLYSWEIAATSGERLMSQGFQLGFQSSGLEELQSLDCFFQWSCCSVFLSFVSGLSLPHTQPVLCNQRPSGDMSVRMQRFPESGALEIPGISGADRHVRDRGWTRGGSSSGDAFLQKQILSTLPLLLHLQKDYSTHGTAEL